jgi:hypothetical protein
MMVYHLLLLKILALNVCHISNEQNNKMQNVYHVSNEQNNKVQPLITFTVFEV